MTIDVHALASTALSVVGSESATRVRRTEASPAYVQGVYQPPTEASLAFSGSIQPARGRDRQLLPEGKRASEAIAIYSTTDLRTAALGVLPDRVTWNGITYEVEKSQGWAAAGAARAYTYAVAVRLGD